ncbi:MAG: hypothetical protein RDV48_08770 [Candidatus Eremiobacteraeota bacterium]|nr:hypothetical protein [Candidatus Eremiobacteraeota bacterium]
MRKRILAGALMAFVLVVAVAVLPICPAEKKSGGGAQAGEFQALHDEVQIGNLLTGLYLTSEQVAKIAPLSAEAEREREHFAQVKEEFARESLPVLKNLRDEVMRTGDASEETKRLHNVIKSRFDREEEAYRDTMKSLNGKVQALLTDNQRIIVAEYKPCLIPVKSISNPERIGQSGDNEGAVKLLTRARELPEQALHRMKEKAAARIQKKLKKEIPEKEIPAFMESISQTIDKARAMSDDEFELRKGELAAKLMPPSKHEDPEKALFFKVDRFLLNPRFAAVAAMKAPHAGTAGIQDAAGKSSRASK